MILKIIYIVVNVSNQFQNQSNLIRSFSDISPSIPYYPIQQPVYPQMYYPPSGQYYYPPPPDLNPYYYPHHHYSNSQQSYGYNHPSTYYNQVTNYNEQYNYYYNQQTSYNSTNDIPNNLVHQSYRRVK